MVKRPFHDDGEDGMDGPAQESKRFKNFVSDVMARLSMRDFGSKMEPFLRAVVRDEVERTILRILQPSSRSFSFHEAEASGGRGLVLQFDNKLSSTIFTASKIEAEDGCPIIVRLLDANTKSTVTSGPLSSMKIDILVLNGDFGSDDRENWNETEFTTNIIRERKGRRPLLAGELSINLKGGVGQIGDVVFTDNSSWQRSRKFRLGARPAQSSGSGVRIREARSEGFMVKDHRGELYKKHYPPRLGDEVWRLERIAKDGPSHKRLASSGIQTVKDFLQLHMSNPSTLREMVGGGISSRIWGTIIQHANSCVIDDDKYYAYFEAGQSYGLLFNSVYKAVAATFDGQNYEHLDKLTPPQKVFVKNLKQQAYENVSNFVPVDANAICGPSRPLTNLQPDQFNVTSIDLQQVEFPIARPDYPDQPEMQLAFNNPTPFGYNAESGSQLGVSLAQSHTAHPLQMLPQMLRNSFRDLFPIPQAGESSWPSTSSQWSATTSSQLPSEDTSQIQTPTSWAPFSSTWGQGNSFLFTSGDEGELGIICSHPRFSSGTPTTPKPRAGWCKLRAALLWGSVKKEAAAKREWHDLLCT